MISRLIFLFTIFTFTTNLSNAQFYSFDLESGYQGWEADFADYTIGDSANWNLSHNHEHFNYITPSQYGLKLDGDNNSDDLFFWVKRKIVGLDPNTQYAINFSIDMVTNMPPDGIGGNEMTLKAGATVMEPQKVQQSGYYRMNIDKDNQSTPGPDMDTLGRIDHDVPGQFDYHLVNFTNSNPFIVETDSNGELWIIVGGEGAFEVYQEFLVAQIDFELSQNVGIDEPEKSNDIKVYPNPFSTHAVITSDNELNDATLSIYNSIGQEIEVRKNIYGKEIIIERENLSPGIYTIKLSEKSKLLKTTRVIVKAN